jgi:hypothetical protein
MQFNQITYARQKNLGNYESEKLEMVVTIEEHEDVNFALREVKIKVAQGLGLQPKVEQIDEVVEGGDVKTKDGKKKDPATGEEAKKTTKKKVAKKAAKKKATKSVAEVPPEIPKESDTNVVTIDAVKESLVKVWKAKGREVADDILKDFGAKKSSDLKETDYEAVVTECTKCLK